MTHHYKFDAETYKQLAFTHGQVDSRAEYRKDDCLDQAMKDPAVAFVALCDGKIITKSHTSIRTSLLTRQEIEVLKPDWQKAVLIGWMINDQPLIAVPSQYILDDVETSDQQGFKAYHLRDLYSDPIINTDELGFLAQSVALLNWHSENRFCGKCGGPTQMQAGGVRLYCPQCQRQIFPRTDPVAIMLVYHGEKCFLARSAHFAPGVYTCLAGFVEQGETLEQAVKREVMEESALILDDVHFMGSQPWPFPHSLMLGCIGRARNTDFKIDVQELEDGRWFDRHEVALMIQNQHPQNLHLPADSAIASALIRTWLEQK